MATRHKEGSEGLLQSQAIDYLQILENQGHLWFTRLNVIPPVQYTPQGMKFRRMPKGAKTGIPDLLIFLNGKTLWVELKSVKGKQSESQQIFECNASLKGNSLYFLVKYIEQLEKIISSILAVHVQRS